MGTPAAWMFQDFGGHNLGFPGYNPAPPPAPVCTSCGDQLTRAEAHMAPAQGGRCAGCQQLHAAGSYCRVCNKVWKPTDKNMVGCDGCDFWIHDTCDTEAARVLASAAEDEQYFCPHCRQASAAQAQLAALAQAEAALRQAQPRNPRSAYELFAGEIAKQYTPEEQGMFGNMQHIVADTWRQLHPQERAPYEAVAQQEFHRYLQDKALFDELQTKYLLLRQHTEASGLFMQQHQQQVLQTQRHQQQKQAAAAQDQRSPPTSGGSRGRGRGSGGSGGRGSGRGRGVAKPKQPPQQPQKVQKQLQSASSRGRLRKHFEYEDAFEDEDDEEADEAEDDDDDEEFDDPETRRRKRKHKQQGKQSGAKRPAPSPKSGPPAKRMTAAAVADGLPQQLPVICHGTEGTFLVAQSRVVCNCAECAGKPASQREMSATHFEAHAGAGAAKKWKSSVRILAGAVPEAPAGGSNLSVGKWLVMVGLEEAKDAKPKGTPPPTGALRNGSAGDKGGKGGHRATVKKEPASGAAGVGGSGGNREIKWEDLPAEAGPDGAAKPRIGRPPKDRPKEGAEKPAVAPWLEIPAGLHTAVRVRWAGDRCSVCDSDVDYDFDQLVSCDACGITVHQSCYGVPEAPGVEDMWLCRACELKEEGRPPPQCCLCPIAGGALKPTTIPGLWAHAACMQWIPEVTVDDTRRMEPVDRIQAIQKERWELLCGVCRQRCGAKIQCTSCYAAYHPLCGRLAGLHMNIDDSATAAGGPEVAVRLVSYCARHCTPHPELSGIRLERDVAAEEEAEADERERSNGLWNAQPFQQPPAAPLPECPAGCARAQPVEEWRRASHGTGTGCSSTGGFWIPDKMPEPPSPPALPLLSKKAGKGRRDSSRAAKPLRPPPKPRELNLTSRACADSDSSDEEEPPSEVELMPLPDDVPEEQDVMCGSKSGVFLTRTQRVVVDGVEMSASRFEQVSGKGDAKKWKSSIYADTPDGPVVMMDWLTERGLDRKALGLLQANAIAHEAYKEHVETEVTALLGGIVDAVERELDPEAAAERAAAVAEQSSEDEEDAEAAAAKLQPPKSLPRAVLKGGPLRKPDGRFMSREEAARHRARLAAGLDPEVEDAASPAVPSAGLPAGIAADSIAAPAAAAGDAASGDRIAASASASAQAQNPNCSQQAVHDSAADGTAVLTDCGAVDTAGGAEAAAQRRVAEEDGLTPAEPTPMEAADAATASATVGVTVAEGTSRHVDGSYQQAQRQASPAEQSGNASIAALVDGSDPIDSGDGTELSIGKAGLAAAAAAAAENGVTLEELVAHLRREGSAGSLNGLAAAAATGPQASSLRSARNSLAKDDDGSRFLEALWAMVPGSPHADSDGAHWQQTAEELDGRLDPIALSRAAADRRSSDQPRPSNGHLSILDRKLTGFSDPGSPFSDRLLHPARSRLSSFDLENALARSSDDEDVQPAGAQQYHPAASQQWHGTHGGQPLERQYPERRPLERQPLHGQSPARQRATAAARRPDLNLDVDDSDVDMEAGAAAQGRGSAAGGGSCTYADADLGLWPAPMAVDGSGDTRGQHQHAAVGPARAEGETAAQQSPQTLEQRLRQAQSHARPATLAADSTGTSGILEPHPAALRATAGEATGAAAHDSAQQRRPVTWIWFPDDEEWYSADVADHDAATGLHRVVYHIDNKGEWLDLAAEQRGGRLRWGDAAGAAAAAHAQAARPAASQPPRQDAGSSAMPADPQGWRVGVWWPDDKQYYYGAVGSRDNGATGQPNKHLIHYDDGIKELLDLSAESLHWVAPPGTEASKAAGHSSGDGSGIADAIGTPAAPAAVEPAADGTGAPSSAAPAAADVPKEPPPDEVGVVCGAVVGVLLTGRLVVRMADGREVSPTEFEREGGKGSSKKWKSSLRVDKGGGVPGRTMAEWLIDVGIDQPRADRLPSERGPAASAAQAAMRRRQGVPGFRRQNAPTGRSSGHAHREGCLCVICKQARKTGRVWAGMTGTSGGGGGGTNSLVPPPPLGRRSAAPGGPPPRVGKRAFLHALPHIPAAGRTTPLWKLPASRAYSCEEYEERHANDGGGGGGGGDDDSDGGRGTGRGLNMKERLAVCTATEKQRLAFGKSGIHGWGLFAKCAIPQDAMVMEYRGEIVRRGIADRREAAYRAAGKDCYLFALNDELVIDSTVGGTIARFTNHCCAPSLYIKVLEVDGRGRLLFFARNDIVVGQELTFDYRFKIEEGAAKLPCRCGAPNCRGTLN